MGDGLICLTLVKEGKFGREQDVQISRFSKNKKAIPFPDELVSSGQVGLAEAADVCQGMPRRLSGFSPRSERRSRLARYKLISHWEGYYWHDRIKPQNSIRHGLSIGLGNDLSGNRPRRRPVDVNHAAGTQKYSRNQGQGYYRSS
jgi:hypothetical protein